MIELDNTHHATDVLKRFSQRLASSSTVHLIHYSRTLTVLRRCCECPRFFASIERLKHIEAFSRILTGFSAFDPLQYFGFRIFGCITQESSLILTSSAGRSASHRPLKRNDVFPSNAVDVHGFFARPDGAESGPYHVVVS